MNEFSFNNFLNGKYIIKLPKITKFRNLDTNEVVLVEKGEHKIYGDLVPYQSHHYYSSVILDSRYIFNNLNRRLHYIKCVKKLTNIIYYDNEWCQNIDNIITLSDTIGNGSWGSVYSAYITSYPHLKFAVKYAKVYPEALKTKNSSSWNEIKILNIFQKLIEKKYTQNLLYLIDNFTCSNPKFKNIEFAKNEQAEKCNVMLFELATCNLTNWLNQPHTLLELQSCLFQIMHALHTMQKFGQIHHFDIKSANILCYRTKKGGYWKYRVLEKDYYVPNLGFVFVLADFGLARSLSPNYIMLKHDSDKTFRLGHRYAVVEPNSKKFIPVDCQNQIDNDGKIIPSEMIKWKSGYYSYGGESRSDREGHVIRTKFKSKSIKRGISKKCDYKNALLFPPFEFYYDTQDVIRMFIGGKRNTQRGNHREFSLNIDFVSSLKKYKFENNSDHPLFSEEAYFVLAGYFIVEYFQNFEKRENIDDNDIIGEYGF